METVLHDRVDRSLARVDELALGALLEEFYLTVSAHSSDTRHWTVRLNGVEFKDELSSQLLSSPAGSGGSTDLALVDLCAKISGKLMVFNASDPLRRVVQLPARVTVK